MIVLASLPRSGSTWLFRSLCGLPQGGNTPPGVQEEHGVVKTHRSPEHEPRLAGFDHEAGDRAVFLWAEDIPAVVESTRRNRNQEPHWRNCADGHPGETWPPADVRDADTFGYERIWRGWADPPVPVLWVRYGALREGPARWWLEAWLRRPVAWLPWRERRTVPSSEARRRIETAYAWLVERALWTPDVRVTAPSSVGGGRL